MGSINIVTHSINTDDSAPIRQPLRHIPLLFEQLVEDMIQKKVVHPSKSPWASPVVLVAKKNGKTRFCVDYGKWNLVTKMDLYPIIPRIDDMLNSLAKAHVFCALD